jgi:hypothetical protein
MAVQVKTVATYGGTGQAVARYRVQVTTLARYGASGQESS